MADTDLTAWLPIVDAARTIGCSTRTVERLGRARKLEQRLRRQEGTPPVAVYNPDDVARIAQERRPAPAPFVLGALPPAHGNGRGLSTQPAGIVNRSPAAGDDPIRQLAAAFQAFLLSPPSPPVSASVAETLYVTVTEAAAILGLPQADVRRLIQDGDLNARQTGRGGIRIRRKDLEEV